MWKRNNM